MSWLFSQALVEDCLRHNCSGGERSAPLNWIGTADAFWSPDRMTEHSDILSQYGMTFVLLTAERGAAEVDADRIRKVARQRASAANAASAASGVKTGAGTAQLIQDDVISSAEEDAQMTIFNGRDAGSRLDAQGEAFKIEGKQARSNANMQSAATVLNSGTEMYSKWKTM